jgi:hypothetical protein
VTVAAVPAIDVVMYPVSLFLHRLTKNGGTVTIVVVLRVEADANKNGNFYSSLDLTCPDGQVEYIDISNLIIPIFCQYKNNSRPFVVSIVTLLTITSKNPATFRSYYPI